MEDVYVHGSVQGADQLGLVGAQGFVSSVDGLGLPVGPVDVLLEQGHGKDVRDVLIQNYRERITSPTLEINHIIERAVCARTHQCVCWIRPGWRMRCSPRERPPSRCGRL